MASRMVGVGAKRKLLKSQQLDSTDLNWPYPMRMSHLGHAIIINNLASEIPQTVADVEALTSSLQHIGFEVKSYKDCDVQGMKKIRDWIITPTNHKQTNGFVLALICHGMQQGWLLDKYKRRAYTLEQLTSGLCAVQTLIGKPKVIIVQEHNDSHDANSDDIPVQHDKSDLFITSSQQRIPTYLMKLATCLEEEYKDKLFTDIIHDVKQTMIYNNQAERLTDQVLAKLGPRISSLTMRNLAVQRLGLTEDQVQMIIDACRDDKQSVNRQILIKWRNMSTTHDRQQLANILYESANEDGQVDSHVVAEVLKLEQLVIREFDTLTQQLDLSKFTPEPQDPAAPAVLHYDDSDSDVDFVDAPETTEKLEATPEQKPPADSDLASSVKQLQVKIAKLESEKESQAEIKRKLEEQQRKQRAGARNSNKDGTTCGDETNLNSSSGSVDVVGHDGDAGDGAGRGDRLDKDRSS